MKKNAFQIASAVLLGVSFAAQANAQEHFKDKPSAFSGDGSRVNAPESLVREKCRAKTDIVFIPGDKPGQPKFLFCATARLVEPARATACRSIDRNIGVHGADDSAQGRQKAGEFLKAHEMYCQKFTV